MDKFYLFNRIIASLEVLIYIERGRHVQLSRKRVERPHSPSATVAVNSSLTEESRKGLFREEESPCTQTEIEHNHQALFNSFLCVNISIYATIIVIFSRVELIK